MVQTKEMKKRAELRKMPTYKVQQLSVDFSGADALTQKIAKEVLFERGKSKDALPIG